MSFKIKVAVFLARSGAFVALLVTNLAGGLLGAVAFINISHVIGISWPTGKQGDWFTALASLVAAICFFGTAYLVGGTRFGDVFYYIDRWVEGHKPHLMLWYHNGAVGVVRKIDFDKAKQAYEEADETQSIPGKPVFYPVQNVMTFSDYGHSERKLTGSMEDLDRLTQECITIHTPFFVPGTSSSKEVPLVISLSDAYKLIHGRAKQ